MKYIPILKWKAAEKKALRDLKTDNNGDVLPLIELVLPSVSEKNKKNPDDTKKSNEEIHDLSVQKLRLSYQKIIDEISENWGNNEILFDTSLLFERTGVTDLRIEVITALIENSDELYLTPVINLNDDFRIIQALKKLKQNSKIKSLCIRLTQSDLGGSGDYNNILSKIQKEINLSENDIHILVDLKYLDRDIEDNYLDIINESQKIVSLEKWKNLIISASAFPRDMTDFKTEDKNFVDRKEWTLWKKECYEKELDRLPSYSDYSTRHPIYNHSIASFQSTASLKYSLENEWIILKGQRSKYKQYLVHAVVLVDDVQNYFRGENFSEGDKYIYKQYNHIKNIKPGEKIKPGNSQTWINASINQHIELVRSQLANLS